VEPCGSGRPASRIPKQLLARILRMRSDPVSRMVGDQVLNEGRSPAGENDGSAEQVMLARAGFIAQRLWAELKRYRRRAQRGIKASLQSARGAVQRVV
jgi:hypothetical protein